MAEPVSEWHVVPYLMVEDAHSAISFLKEAFDATPRQVLTTPDGAKVVHAALDVHGATVFLADEFFDHKTNPKALGGTSVSIHLDVPDVDDAVAQAAAAGATVMMAPADMFWGDRFAKIGDPFGHEWTLSTHVRDVDEAEMRAAVAQMFGGGKA